MTDALTIREIEYDGTPLECHFDVDVGDEGTFATLEHVFVAGVEIGHLLSDNTLKDIERKYWKH